MPETESLPQQLTEQLERIGTADVVIGLPCFKTAADLNWVADLASGGMNVLIACPDIGEATEPEQYSGTSVVSYPVSAPERYLNAPTGVFGSFQEVFQIAQRLGSKACCVWNSAPQLISAGVAERMLRPVLDQNFDLVLPSYSHAKFGALVNSAIVYPLTRALYGRRIYFPMAIDLSFSAQFVARLLQLDPNTRVPRFLQWIATDAICAGLRVCQVALPIDPPRPSESSDLSSILAIVLSRLFSDLERNASFWQRSSGSQNIPTFGEQEIREQDEVAVDVQHMIETFRLGYRNLAQIWAVALSPATLMELKKLNRLMDAEFQMADELWVRIVYEFALAHRQRAINREHLLRAMTPLYLSWVASYTLQMRDASAGGFHSRLERLAAAYENQKPYLLSRWRWPDRFNP